MGIPFFPPPKIIVSLTIGLAMIASYLFFSALTKKEPANFSLKKLNISCFVYRDVNRNGSYDISDRPYAGLTIKMERPHAKTVMSHSNISGFANFIMSLDNDEVPVNQAGQYQVSAIPVEGWTVSSNNETQNLNFDVLKDSPAGIILNKTCDPIGVVPALVISGTIKMSDFESNNPIQSFNSISPSGEVTNITFETNGSYTFPATRGHWKLKLKSRNNNFLRDIHLDHSPVVVSGLTSAPVPSRIDKQEQKIIGFDDLTSSDTLYEIPSGYGAMNWTNWIATHQKFYKGYGYINSTVSDEFMAYNSSGHPATIWSDEPFNFDGVYIGAAWHQAETSDILIRAWRGDSIVFEDKIRAKTSGAIYFDANYRNISKLTFSNETYWQLIIDDFRYHFPSH